MEKNKETKKKKDVPLSEKPKNLSKEFNIEDIWTTGCALNTTGKTN